MNRLKIGLPILELCRHEIQNQPLLSLITLGKYGDKALGFRLHLIQSLTPKHERIGSSWVEEQKPFIWPDGALIGSIGEPTTTLLHLLFEHRSELKSFKREVSLSPLLLFGALSELKPFQDLPGQGMLKEIKWNGPPLSPKEGGTSYGNAFLELRPNLEGNPLWQLCLDLKNRMLFLTEIDDNSRDILFNLFSATSK